MAIIVKPFTFSAGQTIIASEHNSCFDVIFADYNGNIQNTNIAANAAIVDTKLATISTSQKVNTSALVTTSQAIGDILYADTSTTYVRRAVGSQTTFLSGGTSPTYRQVNLGSNDVGNNLPVANLAGGVNASSTTFWRGDGTWVSQGLTRISSTAISSSDNSGNISLSASKIYRVIVSLTDLANDDTISLRVNSDPNSYVDLLSGGGTRIVLGQMDAGSASSKWFMADLLINTFAVTNNIFRVSGSVLTFNNAGAMTRYEPGGRYDPGGASLTDFEIYTEGGQLITGNVYVYEFALS